MGLWVFSCRGKEAGKGTVSNITEEVSSSKSLDSPYLISRTIQSLHYGCGGRLKVNEDSRTK